MITEFKYKCIPISILSHDDHIGKWIFTSRNFYEIGMLEFINELGIKGQCVDIGANIGNHSIFFSQVMGCETIPIEPQEENFVLLFKNLTEEVIPRKFAVSDYEGFCDMSVVPNNMGMCKMVHGDSINVRTLDSLDLTPELIKIDTEGVEGRVLRGGLDTINNYKPHLFIETDRPKKILRMLPSGYNLGQRFNHTPTYHYYV